MSRHAACSNTGGIRHHQSALCWHSNRWHQLLPCLVIVCPGLAWRLAVRLAALPAAEEEERYIQHVVVRLHPTFRPNTLILSQPPYAVRRLGWGIFVVTATVAFKQEWGGGTLVLHWMLEFEGALLPAPFRCRHCCSPAAVAVELWIGCAAVC